MQQNKGQFLWLFVTPFYLFYLEEVVKSVNREVRWSQTDSAVSWGRCSKLANWRWNITKIKAVFSPLGFQINLSGAPPSKPNLFCFSTNNSHPFVSAWQSGMGESVLLFLTNPSQNVWWVQLGLCLHMFFFKSVLHKPKIRSFYWYCGIRPSSFFNVMEELYQLKRPFK